MANTSTVWYGQTLRPSSGTRAKFWPPGRRKSSPLRVETPRAPTPHRVALERTNAELRAALIIAGKRIVRLQFRQAKRSGIDDSEAGVAPIAARSVTIR